MVAGRLSKLAVAVVALSLVSGACTDSDEFSDDEFSDGGGTTGSPGSRDGQECDEEVLGADELTTFSVAHYVVDGRLGEVCLGEESDVLLDAWSKLADIAPPGQLGDLGLFGGFASGEHPDDVSLAFVTSIDDDGTLFSMSVNLEEADRDPDELLLTMAHEFAHVFTGISTQVDRSSEAIDSCSTFYNGEGCYESDALVFQWIQRFWGGGLIDEIDVDVEPTADDGQERCELHPGFFGSYAASSPEEDFAESFSAFVFGLEADSAAQQEKLDWIAEQAGLVEFRDRAESAGYLSLPNNFDRCG